MNNGKLKAIIWDYDGTIADTCNKNYSVSLQIINKITGGKAAKFPALQSPEILYEANQRTMNWRDLYRKEFNFEEEQIDHVGSLWTEHQLIDTSQIVLFDGVDDTLCNFSNVPHAIVSQNSRSSIVEFLESKVLLDKFNPIYGYEQVDIKRQKPFPDGLLNCISQLGIKEGIVIYIGDHVSDFILIENANNELTDENKIKIVSVGIKHLADVDKHWHTKPNYTINNFAQLRGVVAEILNNRTLNEN